jgi:hypothetical protein
MHQPPCADEVHAVYNTLEETVREDLNECARTLAVALIHALGTELHPPPEVTRPSDPPLFLDGRETQRSFRHGEVEYTALAGVGVNDARAPWISVYVALGRGRADRALEVAVADAACPLLTDPGTAAWTRGQIGRIRARAADVARLAVPILRALDEESAEGPAFLRILLPTNADAPLRIAAPG